MSRVLNFSRREKESELEKREEGMSEGESKEKVTGENEVRDEMESKG